MVTTTAQRIADRLDQARQDGRREERQAVIAMVRHCASLWPIDRYPPLCADPQTAEGAAYRQAHENLADQLEATMDGE